MSTDQATDCPNCGRSVEAGFKFCDFCGTKLDAVPTPPPPAGEQQPKKPPLFERMRNQRAEKRAEAERAEDAIEELGTKPGRSEPPEPESEDPPAPDDTGPIPAPTARPGIASRPMKAEDLRSGARSPGFAGRLQWREEPKGGPQPTPRPEAPAPTEPGWRPAAAEPPRSWVRTIGVAVLHIVIAFLTGSMLLGIAAVVASMTSNGGVALLETRGLPIFIAGATAIIVFSLFRTGPRMRRERRPLLISVAGFVVLVVAVALVFRPSLMADAQRELDRSLGVFGPDVADAVQKFEGDVEQWNVEVQNYRTDLVAVSNVQRREPDAETRADALSQFSVAASGVEAALEGTQKRMVSRAESIDQAPLRDALRDLAKIFDDQLAGIRLLTRGFVTNDQTMIKSGDTRFKDSASRAVEFFGDRVRPILERAEIDPAELERRVSALTRR